MTNSDFVTAWKEPYTQKLFQKIAGEMASVQWMSGSAATKKIIQHKTKMLNCLWTHSIAYNFGVNSINSKKHISNGWTIFERNQASIQHKTKMLNCFWTHSIAYNFRVNSINSKKDISNG